MRRTLGCLVVAALALTGCGAEDSSRSTRPSDRAAFAAGTTTTRVVAVGDIACPPGARVTRTTCRQAATARAAQALRPDKVLVLGDLQYQTGRYRAFQRSYDRSWGALRSITWPIPGNHEYETSGARGYYRYFSGQQPGAPGWYHRTLGGWEMYFLNSNCGKVDCVAQRAWLERELASDTSTCSLIALHHPRFSSGEHGNNRAMRRFWQIADAHGVDVALAGHDHDYERFVPMDSTGQPDVDGIRQFVSGGGGRSLYPRQSDAPGSQIFLKRFGVLELNLSTSGYSWKFRTPKLRVRDSGSAACR